MTPAKSGPTNVVVVDGSNIATEGRSMPSLAQLNEAVMAFTEEFPDAIVTVVVDATFGHRIDKKELAEFDAAVAHNEVVAPPAGAIGRGDAFVLSIANKVGARILSNDSFQEFHGDYPWLFDEGRLIGGKPVPFVGWVFVERLPVKGPISRKATRSTRGGGREREREPRPSRRTASRAASLPMPVPTVPPPGPRRGDGDGRSAEPAVAVAVLDGSAETSSARTAVPTGGPVNDLLPFLDFVEHHPVGSSVNGVVESYSSHGAYVMIGDLRGYIPLRLMGEPPPRSAREIMKLGDAVTLVVTSFAPARRSVDLAIPEVAPVTDPVATLVLDDLAEAVAAAAPVKPSRRRGAKKAAPEPVVDAVETPADEVPAPEPAAKAPRKRAAAKRAATKRAAPEDVTPEAVPAEPASAEPAPAKRSGSRRAAAKAAADPVVVEPAVAEPVVAAVPAPKPARTRKAAAKKAAAPAEPATPPARKAKAAASKAPAKAATAKKAAAGAAGTAAARKAPAKRAAKKVATPKGGGAA